MSTSSAFVEAALWLDRDTARAAFDQRRNAPTTQAHLDAAALVDRSGQPDPMGQMYDSLVKLVESRPATKLIDAKRGDVDGTLAALHEAISSI